MRFGSVIKTTSNNGIVKATVLKYHDYTETVNETVYEQRVQIMKVSDFDTIVEEMHKEHALDKGYGAWLDKTKDGKLYVVKSWIKEGS
jgi:preprotein translocase subunit SecA